MISIILEILRAITRCEHAPNSQVLYQFITVNPNTIGSSKRDVLKKFVTFPSCFSYDLIRTIFNLGKYANQCCF